MERRGALRHFVTASAALLPLILLLLLAVEARSSVTVSSGGSATTASPPASVTGAGLGNAVSDGGSESENGSATTPATVSAASNNHSYELKCWPRARLLVDERAVEVTRSFRAVLRVLCVLARAAAQDNHPNATSVRSDRNPGFRFGFLTTEEAFDANEYQSQNGTEATNKFDLMFTDGQADNSTNIFATFSYTCQYAAPGHQLLLEDRALRARSVAWVLLARLACREWWEARAPPDSGAEDAADAAASDERAMDAFTRRLRSALNQAREVGQRRGEGGGSSPRVARGLADNRVDELQSHTEALPRAFPPRHAVGSWNHSYDVSCAAQRERLRADGMELQMTRHLQSVVRYVCALLRPRHAKDHFSATDFHSLGYIVTTESFDPKNYAWNSSMGKKLDVEYADGHRRNGRHVFPVLVRCSGRATPILSVRGHTLAPQSLAWGLVARGLQGTAHCGGAAPHAPSTRLDDAQAWRLMQSRSPPTPTRASAPSNAHAPATVTTLQTPQTPSQMPPPNPQQLPETSPRSSPQVLPQTPCETHQIPPQILPQTSRQFLDIPLEVPPQIFPKTSLKTPVYSAPQIPPEMLLQVPSPNSPTNLPHVPPDSQRMIEPLSPITYNTNKLQMSQETLKQSQTSREMPLVVDPPELPSTTSTQFDPVSTLNSFSSSPPLMLPAASTPSLSPSSSRLRSSFPFPNPSSIPSSSSIRYPLPALFPHLLASSSPPTSEQTSTLPPTLFTTLFPQPDDHDTPESPPPDFPVTELKPQDIPSPSPEKTPAGSSPTRRHGERPAAADGVGDGSVPSPEDSHGDGGAPEPDDEEDLVNCGENLPTPERLDSGLHNNKVISSEEYMDDGEDFHHHSYVLRCGESGALDVDGMDVRVTSHMAAALFFLCALLTSAQGSRATAYDFGTIRTVEAYRTEDVAVGSESDARLDVLYEGGALPRSLDVNIFWQTCRPDPPGPEFSLDSGPLLPHSIVWSLFSKVRCGPGHEDSFPGAERYFGDDIVSADKSSEELLPSHSDRHNYVIRCTPGEEAMEIDGLQVRLTAHMESALGLLCFSAGLHGHDNVTRK